jgi:hypothetical protein
MISFQNHLIEKSCSPKSNRFLRHVTEGSFITESLGETSVKGYQKPVNTNNVVGPLELSYQSKTSA